uniref:Small vasohibin-binding protein n=1 Tax=Calidris pygmaea TaxID=425635 RepID=A0A8C3J4Q2_9CHAR
MPLCSIICTAPSHGAPRSALPYVLLHTLLHHTVPLCTSCAVPYVPQHAVPSMEPSGGGRKERPKPREPAARLEKAKQKSAQQELKQRQRAEIYALNRVMTELEQQQFDSFCKQMQASGE